MKKKILIVEDDEDIRDAFMSILEMEGFSMISAPNGKVALDLLSQAKELPGLIFLDVMMPVMDGIQFLTLKKENPKVAEIPVVVLTAGTQKNDWPHVVEYLKKPVDLGRLLEIATQFIAPQSR